MTTALLVLAGSLALLTLGADVLVRSASALSLRLGIKPLVVGLVVVGFGTSTPELAASVIATLRGAPDVSVGNVVGSNVFNVAVILGLTALVRPIVMGVAAVRRELALVIAVAAVPFAGLLFGGTLPRAAGGTMLLALLAYVVGTYRAGRAQGQSEAKAIEAQVEKTLNVPRAATQRLLLARDAALALLGLACLLAGSRYFVDAAIGLARDLGVSEMVIGLFVVAAGTSLPELATSLVAAFRRSADLAVGNILGSNVFNVLGILGTTALLRPPALSRSVLLIDAPVMLLASAALEPLLRSGGRLSRGEGALLLAGYAAYAVARIATAPP